MKDNFFPTGSKYINWESPWGDNEDGRGKRGVHGIIEGTTRGNQPCFLTEITP